MAKTDKQYTVVVNASNGRVSIPHSDPTVADIMLEPYASVVIDPDVWDDVDALEQATAGGQVYVDVMNQKPKAVPGPPANMPASPSAVAGVRQIVFLADEQQALEYINLDPLRENTTGEPTDVSYLKKSMIPVLQASAAWLRAWGRPDRAKRIKAIEARLAAIKEM